MRKSNNGHRLLVEEKEQILTLFKSGLSSYKISKIIGFDPVTVKNYLIKYKLYEPRKHRKYICNHKYFNTIDTEDKAYWFGFIAADGCIKKGHTLSIYLQSTDKQHLILLLNYLNANYPIRDEKKIVKNKIYFSAGFSVHSYKLVQNLIAKGITERKSLTLKYPKIDSCLMRHFIRGYFDGDGCFWCSNKDTTHGYPKCSYSFTGSPFFIPDLQKEIAKNCGLKENIYIGIRNGKSKNFGYSGKKNCNIIYHYLYDNASVFLARKKKKAESFLSQNWAISPRIQKSQGLEPKVI
jgi:hypothetical protein